MRRFAVIITLFTQLLAFAQSPDTLHIHYYAHLPFAYSESGNVKGIEVDILNEYILWLKAKKKIHTVYKYSEYTDFQGFYRAVKGGASNAFGLGSVTVNADRLKEIDFTSAYIRSVAFCITNGNAPDVKTKNADEIVRSLGSMNAQTMMNTSLQKYVNEIKRTYIQDLKVSYQPNEIKILDEISKNVLSFGYVDAIAFWIYLKNNPGKFLKMQKILSQSKEEMGFILPKGSPHKALFNEFFAVFKTSPTYRAILEKYLGSYMAQNVAIN